MGLLGLVISWLNKFVILMFIFTFITSGLVLNVIQLFFLPLYWINRRRFRIINSNLVYFHWALIPWSLQNWAKYEINVYSEDSMVANYKKEHALCVLNHRGDLDWMIGWCLIERIGMLGGAKAIVKDLAKYIPGMGWMFMFMEYPVIKRNWNEDQRTLAASCRNLADYPVNMLLCLFAEGTRFTEEKHKISMEVAKEKGLPLLKHHLLPRTRGFVFLMKHMRDTIPAIYDITFGYREGVPSILGVIDRISCSCDILIRRIPTSEVPTDSDEACANFLHELYQKKDEFVEYHMKHKRFPSCFKVIDVPLRPWPMLVFILWVLLICIPVVLLAIYWVWIGAWYILVAMVTIIFLANQAFFIIVKLTEARSSQGLQTHKDKKNGDIKTD